MGPAMSVTTEEPPTVDATASPAEGWSTDKNGRQFAPARGRGGRVFRHGDETLEEAYARDASTKRDPPPKSRGGKSRVPKAPAPTAKTIVELEFMLVELLRSPEMVTAATGDEWATEHFHREAPVLARNLAQAADRNPWLRRKLEAMLTAEDLFIVRVLSLIPVAAAAIAYALPPIIYFLDPGFIPASARDMFHVPYRPEKPAPAAEERDGSPPTTAQAAGPAVPTGA